MTMHSQYQDETVGSCGFATGRAAVSRERQQALWDTLEPHRLTLGEQQADGSAEKQTAYLKEWLPYFTRGMVLDQNK